MKKSICYKKIDTLLNLVSLLCNDYCVKTR